MNRKQLVLVVGSFIAVGILIGASVFLRQDAEEDDGMKVVATFYPLAYMAESIGGERVSVSSMVPYNSELHSWTPSPQDIIRAENAQLILYNGGPADAWLVSEVLPAIGPNGRVVANTTAGVEFISGGHEGEGHEDEGAVDPHTWLSPRRAMSQAENVYKALCEADPDGISYFTPRFASLNQSLAALDAQYSSLANASVPGVIVSHAAFGYLAHDYGFEQHGVIGLSADEDPSAATLIALADMMESSGIFSVMVDPVYKQSYGQALKSDLESRTDHTVTILEVFLALGPYQDPKGNADYLDQLQRNLVSLKAGLGVA